MDSSAARARVRIQIDPRELHSKAPFSRPDGNLPQQIAAATAHIDDVQRLSHCAATVSSQASVGR